MARFNKAVLDAVLRSQSLSEEMLSTRAGISLSEFTQQLRREQGPTQSLINAIAKELSVPPFVFYMKEPPHIENNIVDFRHPSPVATPKSRSTIESIQIAHAIQREATKLGYSKGRVKLPAISVDFNAAARFAHDVRQFFEITVEDQVGAKDARLFYYQCRQKIEAKQIFVLQDSFSREDGSGYVLWHELCPVIVINSSGQTYARRLFTLAHELAHLLLRQTGISDPFVRTNRMEQFCNLFAAEFLVPGDQIDNLLGGISVPRVPSTADVARIARKLKFSQEASVIRLEQLGRMQAGSHQAWLTAVSNIGNPDYQNQGGGRGRPAEEKIKLAKYGFYFANTFERAVAEREITDIELYRIAGIKPRWLSSFFAYARSGDLEGMGDE